MSPDRRSWIASANDPDCGFPLNSLPWCVFHTDVGDHIGIGIGDRVLDLHACVESGLLGSLSDTVQAACRAQTLNSLMALGPDVWQSVRNRMTELLAQDTTDPASLSARAQVEKLLQRRSEIRFVLPAAIGDYTDFYASQHHARRVGQLFRPQNPLLPNYSWVPIGYHGRASSIVLGNTPIRRPWGQQKREGDKPAFAPSARLDYEAEIGLYIGAGNPLGTSIPVDSAESHIFGLCVLNDWSARDLQSWEYQPLGPFLAKSFATSVSPWVVPLAALESYRVPGPERTAEDPAPLPYLRSSSFATDGFDVTVSVSLRSARMRDEHMPSVEISRSNLRSLFWSLRQLVTHHTSNGCNLRPGDLLATGTISGPDAGSEGCLLEMQATRGKLQLPTGEVRDFLEDGDEVTLRAVAERPAAPRIEVGCCTAVVLPAATSATSGH